MRAEAARERYRRSDGRFGVQSHAELDLELAEPDSTSEVVSQAVVSELSERGPSEAALEDTLELMRSAPAGQRGEGVFAGVEALTGSDPRQSNLEEIYLVSSAAVPRDRLQAWERLTQTSHGAFRHSVLAAGSALAGQAGPEVDGELARHEDSPLLGAPLSDARREALEQVAARDPEAAGVLHALTITRHPERARAGQRLAWLAQEGADAEDLERLRAQTQATASRQARRSAIVIAEICWGENPPPRLTPHSR